MTRIIKIPFVNGLGKTMGCKEAPEKIINEVENIFTNEIGKKIGSSELGISEISVDNSDIDESSEKIHSESLKYFSGNEKVIFLGGDHSISYPVGKAFLENCKNKSKNPCLIIFDAHPDLMPAVDKKAPTHEEWLRQLIEEEFPVENILLVGNRNSDIQELEFIKDKKIQRINIDDIQEDVDNIADTIMEFAFGRELYLSLDIDVVDPVFAPGTGYKEVGGLTSREMIYLVKRINKMRNLKAVDIVEINPRKDNEGLTTRLGAKILAEFI